MWQGPPTSVPPAPAAGVGSLLAEDLPATALCGLATLAARFSTATILFDAIFVPSDNRIVEAGRIRDRPDVAYCRPHDETATAVTLKEVRIDGQQRTLVVGRAAPNGLSPIAPPTLLRQSQPATLAQPR